MQYKYIMCINDTLNNISNKRTIHDDHQTKAGHYAGERFATG